MIPSPHASIKDLLMKDQKALFQVLCVTRIELYPRSTCIVSSDGHCFMTKLCNITAIGQSILAMQDSRFLRYTTVIVGGGQKVYGHTSIPEARN
jgi:hypothetical protein